MIFVGYRPEHMPKECFGPVHKANMDKHGKCSLCGGKK